MKIRYKILLSLVLIMAVLTVSLYFVAETVMIESITASETAYSIQNAQRFEANLDIAIDALENNVNDWAKWDDTYYFMENQNPQYIESNMLDDTFNNLQLNMIFCFDTSKQLVYGKMFDLVNQTATPVTDEVVNQVASYGRLFGDDAKTPHGIIVVGGVPMLAASQTILTSQLEGPNHGIMVMGRFLDAEELEVLSESTGLPVSIINVNDPNFESVLSQVSMEKPIYATPLNETQIAGYTLLIDVQNSPVALAKVLDVRTQYAQGRAALTYITEALVVIGLVTFAVVAILLEKIVVSRVTALNQSVSKIRKTGDNSGRVKVKGKDEISNLSENINGMLQVIEQHTQTLEETVQERTKNLFENQEKLRTILSASPDAIIATDLNSKITECNSQMCEISGFTREALIGKYTKEFLAEKRSDEYLQGLSATIKRNHGVTRLETKLLRSNGSHFPAEASINTMRNEAGETVGFVIIVRDLSERKIMEERLAKSERLAAIGELAGMVGHDLRNPLTAIKNAGYILKKKCINCKEPRGVEMLDVIDKSITHSNKIINDLLEYAREVHLDLTDASLKSLLNETLSMIKVPNKVRLVDETTDFTLKVDESKVVRVIINLIKNGFDAMPTGGTLNISSRRENGYVYMEFEDTGVGIPEETMTKLFTPLYTTKAQGMGFGLSISKRVVEAHGGKIQVQSIVGQGTTCTISFPENVKSLVTAKRDWVIDQDFERGKICK